MNGTGRSAGTTLGVKEISVARKTSMSDDCVREASKMSWETSDAKKKIP